MEHSIAIDHARVTAISQGSGVAQAEVLAEFRRMNTQDAGMLRDAVRESNFQQAALLAHRMKGASLMLGASQFSETCSLIAMASRAEDLDATRTALVFLEREMAALNEYLEALQDGGLPEGEAETAVVSAEPAPAMLCSHLTFCVVEDHAFQRNVLLRFLRRLGAEQIDAFEHGADALAAVNDGSCAANIMVLDLSMPGMDGMELIRALSASRNPISLIINTALSPSLLASVVQVAKKCRVNLLGTISKPLDEAKLAPLIAKYRAGRLAPVEANPQARVDGRKAS